MLSTTWPEAAVGIAGILLIASIVVVVVCQVFATWRARITARQLAAVQSMAAESAELRRRNLAALERLEGSLGTASDRAGRSAYDAAEAG